MPRTSIVIPCLILDSFLLNTLVRCVEAIKNTTRDYELIICDNASPVGESYMREVADVYIRNKENIGVVKSGLRGWEVAVGDYIVGGNCDVIIKTDGWNEIFIDILNIVPNIASINPQTDPEEHEGNVYPIGITGSFCMFKRDVYEKIGKSDKRFRNYFSDTDYQRRIEALGLACYETSLVKADHIGHATFSRVKEEDKSYEADKKLFIEKWGL